MAKHSTRRVFVTTAAAALGLVARGRAAAPEAQRDRTSIESTDAQLVELVAANRILAQQGIVDTLGHVSVRSNRHPDLYLMSRSLAAEFVTADDIIVFDLHSNPVGTASRSLYGERFIHGEIYSARPDVRAVVHSHSPSVIPFGVTGTPLRAVYAAAGFIGDGTPVFDTRKVSGRSNLLISDPVSGRALAQMLGSRGAVLMRGHGAAVVGASLPIVVARSIYLELNAKLQMQAMALGPDVSYLDAEEARQMTELAEATNWSQAWDAWKRKATASSSAILKRSR